VAVVNLPVMAVEDAMACCAGFTAPASTASILRVATLEACSAAAVVAPVTPQVSVHNVLAGIVSPTAVKMTFALELTLASTVVVKVVWPQVPANATGLVPATRVHCGSVVMILSLAATGASSLKTSVTGVAVLTYGKSIVRLVEEKTATAVAVDAGMVVSGMSLAPAIVAAMVRVASFSL